MRIINQTLGGFIKKEFRQVLRDSKMRTLLFAAPVIQMTLFGFALSTDVKNIRLAVPYSRDDTVLEHVYQHALESGWFIPAKTKHADPFEQIQEDEADAVLVPPTGGLTRAIGRGDGQVQLLVNASNVLKAQSIESYMKAVIKSVVAKDMKQTPDMSPIQFDMRILYNPSLRSAVFQVPAVMGMLICLITVLLPAMSVSKEKEQGTFEMLISSPATSYEIILGKTIPYVVLGLSNLPLILGVAVLGFGVPMRGSLLELIFSAGIFVCVTVSIGILISTLAKTQQQSMMGGFLFLFPAIQLSGLMFPIANMPAYMKIFAYVNPLTYFIELLRNIMLKGGDPHVVATNVLVLTFMAAILVFISFKRFKTTLG